MAGRGLHDLDLGGKRREVAVLHLAEVGKSFPANTNPDSSLSAQHPLVPLPNPGNAWSVVAGDLILEGLL